MMSKVFSAAAVVLAASSLVSAQTSTLCNPLKKACPADTAFGGTTTCDFTKGACSTFDLADGTNLKYDSQGAVFTITKDSDAPTIHTDKYIFFGKVEVVVQAAPGVGIVTSAVLLSDDLDEIDWEWVGGDNAQVQTNYFSKGDTSTYDRGAFHNVANPTAQFHTYTLEWTSQAVTWSIDGAVVRTLTAASAKAGAAFPQTPMQVKLGTWIGGRKDAPKGVVQWAGGYADYSKGPFLAYYKSITITDYAGKDKPANGGIKQYIYSDNSGSWQSIKVVVGSGDDTSTSSAASSATPTIGSKTFQASSTASTEAVVSKTTSLESKTTFASPSSSASSTRSDSGSGNSTASTVAGSSTSRAANSTASTIGPQTFPASSTSSTVSAVLRTTSAESKTTLVTATSSASSIRSGSGSGNSTASTVAGSSTSRAVGSTAPTILPSVAARGVVAVGSVLLAGAGILAVQLLL